MVSEQNNIPNKPDYQKFVQNYDSPWIGKKVADRKSLFFSNLIYRFAFYVLSKPAPLIAIRAISFVLRKLSPISIIGGVCILTRHEDVREVLTRMEDFSSADTMNLKTPAGPFVLSLDWRIQHDRELEILKKASFPFVNEDASRVRDLAATKANEVIDQAVGDPIAARTKINIAAGLTETVALHIVERYIGVSALNGEKSREDLRSWLRVLAAQIFTTPPVGSQMQARTAAATSGLITYLHKVMATLDRNGPPLPEDTLLQRLVKIVEQHKKKYPWADDDWICALVAGMITAGNATVARAQTQAIYRIMTLSGAKILAMKAAGDYRENQNPQTRTALLQIVYEALRFNPMLPVLSPRYCIRDTVIAPDTDREKSVCAGINVMPLVFAAMFDPLVFENPGRFIAGRELENYLHFGWGPHMCFGKFVAEIQFIETAAALFGRKDIQVETISSNKITYQGPAVIEYPLDLVSGK